MDHDVADRKGEARSDTGKLIETGGAVSRENLCRGSGEPSQRVRGSSIRSHAVRVGRLCGEKGGNLVEAIRDVVVRLPSHANLEVPDSRELDVPSPTDRRDHGEMRYSHA